MISIKFKLLFSVVGLFTFHPYFSQDDTLYNDTRTPLLEDRNEEVFDSVEEEAKFVGGVEGLQKYIQKSLIYPKIALESNISGKSFVRFIIDKGGSIYGVRVARGISDCPECDREAVRVVKNMPNWIPAKHNGKVVQSSVLLPIEFKLP